MALDDELRGYLPTVDQLQSVRALLPVQRERIKIDTFAAGTGTVEAGTPLYRDASGHWKVWSNGHLIEAFAFQDEAIVLDASHEVLGAVLIRGLLRYQDVVLPAGESQDLLDAALTQGLRKLGLQVDIVPLDGGVHGRKLLKPAFIASGAQVFNPTITQM